MDDVTGLGASPDRLTNEEGKWSGKDVCPALTESDQSISEEQNYRETIRGNCNFTGWSKIPDFKTPSSSADKNSWVGHRAQPRSEVNLPKDLKVRRLNLQKTGQTEAYRGITVKISRLHKVI